MKTNDPISFREEFFNLVESTNSILITAHMGPDADAMGSVVAVYNFLKRKYPAKRVEVYFSGVKLSGWDYFKCVYDFKVFPDIYEEDLNKFDVIIFLDGMGAQRFGLNVSRLDEFKGKKIGIDHHKTEAADIDLMLHDPHAASTAELIYTALFEDGGINKEEAEALLLGIYGDSGQFQFITKEKANTLRVAADLIEAGDISVDALMGNFEGYSKEIFEIIREAVKNTKFENVEGWPGFTYAIIPDGFVLRNGYEYEQLKFAVAMYLHSFVKKVDGYDWGFIIYTKLGNVGVSFRARKDGVNVRKIVEDLGVGGGHDQAAGSEFPGKKAGEVLEVIKKYLKDNPPKFT